MATQSDSASSAVRLALVAVLMLSSQVFPAVAQYRFNPSAAHEQVPGIRYFGTAKDANGARLVGTTVILTSKQATYVFFTDELGAYSGMLPLAAGKDAVTLSCSKAGFKFKRANKRGAAPGAADSVQFDCVLTAARQQ